MTSGKVPFTFEPSDRVGQDLLTLASGTATAAELEKCQALLDLPIITLLNVSKQRTSRVTVLFRVIQCTLFLAHEEIQKTSDLSVVNKEAADSIAAGALFGLVRSRPGESFPLPGKFVVRTESAEARQRNASYWKGSTKADSPRRIRTMTQTQLRNFYKFMNDQVETGALAEAYLKFWPDAAHVAAERDSADTVGIQSTAVPELAEHRPACQPPLDGAGAPTSHEASGWATTRARRRKIFGMAAGALVALGTIGVVAIALPDGHTAKFRVSVATNLDKLVLDPKLMNSVGQSYVTHQPIYRVPPPPGSRDSCDGRWAWAHSPALQAIDADSTIALVDLTPLSHDASVVGAQVYFDNDGQTPSVVGTYLTCPGRGGNPAPDTFAVDLDTGKISFYPSGAAQPATLNLHIAKGTEEALVIEGNTLDRFSRWRLELSIDDGHGQQALTIGASGYAFGLAKDHPEVKPFETTGSLASKPYRFIDGQWKLGR